MNVHDDLTFFLPDDSQVDERIKYLAKEMVKVRFGFINVPIIVEVSMGDNWADCKEIMKFSSEDF